MDKRNVIWITSYPKSGNTWIHSVLRLAGKNHGFPQVDMDAYNILKNEGRPEICHAVHERFSDNPCVVLKTHSPYKADSPIHSFPGIELINTGYLHIYRNPLDVLLSYLNFTRLEYKPHKDRANYRKRLFEDMLGFSKVPEYEEWLSMSLESIPKQNLDHALDYFSDHGLSISTLTGMAGTWIENTQSWMDATTTMPGHSLRYEDCLEDPEQFVKFCDFFRFDRKDVLLALDFVNSRARSAKESGTKDQTVFYNKMSAYYFTSFFSTGAISRFFGRNEDVLRRFGYSEILDLV